MTERPRIDREGERGGQSLEQDSMPTAASYEGAVGLSKVCLFKLFDPDNDAHLGSTDEERLVRCGVCDAIGYNDEGAVAFPVSSARKATRNYCIAMGSQALGYDNGESLGGFLIDGNPFTDYSDGGQIDGLAPESRSQLDPLNTSDS